jgi:hypothetical protein
MAASPASTGVSAEGPSRRAPSSSAPASIINNGVDLEFLAPAPESLDYIPRLLPTLLDSHKAKIRHIGLPHRLIWAGSTYRQMLHEVYTTFPNVQYFWIYRHNCAKRLADVGTEVRLSVDRFSVGEKHLLNIRKYVPIYEDWTGNLVEDNEVPAVALKHSNELKFSNVFRRNPDVRPRAIRFRRYTTYRP